MAHLDTLGPELLEHLATLYVKGQVILQCEKAQTEGAMKTSQESWEWTLQTNVEPGVGGSDRI